MANNSRKYGKIKKVIKFGGSCLKDRSSLLQAVSIIKNENERVALVVSALSGVTDLLLDAYHLALGQEKNFRGIINSIEKRHLLLASEVLSLKNYALLAEKYRELFFRLNRLVRGIALSGEASTSLKATVLSYGERLSAHLLAATLKEAGLETRVYESEKAGLVATKVSEEAEADLEAFDRVFRSATGEVEAGNFIPVFTGFYGLTPEGRTALFGRNGSDYTAACVARGFRASRLVLYKDVPGFLTADPEKVPEARPIPSLSRLEAAELSYFGAKILHPRIWEPLEPLNCSVEIRSFKSPEAPGTIIKAKAEKSANIIKSLSASENLAVLRVEGPGVGSKPGIIGLLGTTLARNEVNILTVLTSQTCINLILSASEGERALRLVEKIQEPAIRKVLLEKDLALVAAVGHGIRETDGLAGKIFSTLASARINVEFFSTGASETAIYLLLKKNDTGRAVRLLHQAFFGEKTEVRKRSLPPRSAVELPHSPVIDTR